jgi:hypothetical protein
LVDVRSRLIALVLRRVRRRRRMVRRMPEMAGSLRRRPIASRSFMACLIEGVILRLSQSKSVVMASVLVLSSLRDWF